MKHLFICAVGPVQEFIATARRSRDLWYGSWMLSELSKAAAKALAEETGIENLIFPAPKEPDELLSGSELTVANKILSVTNDSPSDVGKRVRQAVKNRLEELQKDAFPPAATIFFNPDLAKKQLADLIEFYWASVPYPESADYTKKRNEAEALLAARKNTRNFQQFGGAMVPKSSLDASRESVIHEDAYPDNRDDSLEEQKRKIRQLYRDYGARRGERLSGVDLLKRLGRKGASFPSTSEMAARPFLNGLGAKAYELLSELKQYLANDPWEVDVPGKGEELLYTSRLSEFLIDKELETASKGVEEILTKYAKTKHPSPYYAILAADGDNMGEMLDSLTKPSDNREFSQALSQFSHQADRIIHQHGGEPIYLGGDDILIYLPLDKALACAVELQHAMGSALHELKIKGSLSGGLVIAHHLQPLSEVLELARRAEKEAKQVKGKDALCIVLNKRSGSERFIKAKWDTLIERMQILSLLHHQKAISKGTAYELQDLHRRLENTGLPDDAFHKEALRIIKRKRESGSEINISEDVEKQFETWISQEKISIHELALEMIVAETFAEAQEEAVLSPKTKEAQA